MSEIIKTRLLVVGAGPGGYVAAIRAGQLGIETTIVENTRLGGTCLTRGCIPSKALIHVAEEMAMIRENHEASHFGIRLGEAPTIDLTQTTAWKDSVVDRLSGGVGALLKRAKVRSLSGWAEFSDAKTCTVETEKGKVTVSAEHVLLATGSVPVELEDMPFGGSVLSSTEALSLDALPGSIAVIGAGYIGLELGMAFAKLGAKVTVVEAQDRILPLWDADLVAPVRKALSAAGIDVHLSSLASGIAQSGKTTVLHAVRGGERFEIPADKIIVTVGRRPATHGWGLERMGVDMDGPFVKVDAQCRTSMRDVWAIGDLVGEPMLAHKASAQGEMVAEMIAGKKRRFAPAVIPAVCFTDPEVVSVGLSPDEAKRETNGAFVVGNFPFAANGRALSMGAGDNGGFVRVVARDDDHRIVGIQAVGKNVGELSTAFAHAVEMGETLEDVGAIIHAHPTLGEAFHEAALRALGHAIHI